MTDNSKWVACWGNATSITNRREAVYAKALTLYANQIVHLIRSFPIYKFH